MLHKSYSQVKLHRHQTFSLHFIARTTEYTPPRHTQSSPYLSQTPIPHLGAFNIIPIRQPEMMSAHGSVMNQPMYIHATILQLIVLHVLLQSPKPTVAPVIRRVVLTGSANFVARIIVPAALSSIENPRLGECSVILLPSARIMLYPYVHSPTTMPAPPNARIHSGTGTLSEILAVLHTKWMVV
jgi:hypothetical protein